MTDATKEKLRKYGIAPPSDTVICPQCNSEKTTLISDFGATACKALYKCSDCLEPFEFFKCI
jgi:ring-1,2-phenylacetyl-CoA epoxidase subunit PaaD